MRVKNAERDLLALNFIWRFEALPDNQGSWGMGALVANSGRARGSVLPVAACGKITNSKLYFQSFSG